MNRLNMIERACEQFPETFQMKGFPNETFRVNSKFGYISGGCVFVHVETLTEEGWVSVANEPAGYVLGQIKPEARQ